ncbi:MAG: metallophosphoesterase family protein, partial [Thioalkalispiraceae bacterium]
MTKTTIFKRIILGFISLLVIAALGWFSTVWYQSRVTGDRPVYLQLAAPDKMTLRWGTETASADRVFYGLGPDQLDNQQQETEATVNHRIRLQGLTPATRYYYRIKHRGEWLQPQAEWFYTSPLPTSNELTRLWILGDPGKSRSRAKVQATSLAWLNAHPRENRGYADVLLTTGDNAYPSASTADYAREFFTPYQKVLKNIPLWTVFGNHDARRWTYYKLFDVPLNGESGGLASHSKHYYSFDYAQAHIIILDSHHFELAPETAMTEWLQADINQARQNQDKQKWIIVLFHHPPYTGGTYDSDNESQSRGRMTRVRKYLIPVLEKAGVDLVINGHSHVYERSHLLHCHYGVSGTFADNKILDHGHAAVGSGNDQQLVYSKPKQNKPGITGTIYMVLGSSGEGNK